MSSGNGTTISLTLYIPRDTLTALDSTFTLARNVNGVSNVIFQSKTKRELLSANNFAWKQAYKIAATDNVADGALVSRQTSQVDIQDGYVSYWSDNDLQPESKPQAIDNQGNFFNNTNFGTVNVPNTDPPLRNIIYCATAGAGSDSVYVPIYVDGPPSQGDKYRSYTVENSYLVSFEDSSENQSAGVYVQTWSGYFALSIPAGETAGWISWGPSNADGTDTRFFQYRQDPGRHDPNSPYVIPQTATVVSNGAGLGASAPTANSVEFDLNWDNLSYLSDSGKRAYATRLGRYLTASKPSFLTLALSNNSTALIAKASLDTMSDFYDLLEGCSRDEKTVCLVQSLLRGTSCKFTPTSQVIKYGQSTSDGAVGGFLSTLNLIWTYVGPNAPTLAAAGIPVAFYYLRNLINARYASTRPVEIQYTPPVINNITGESTGTATLNISGVNATDVVAVLGGIITLVRTEGGRTRPVPNAPDLPTPDPVIVDTNNLKTDSLSRAGGALVVPIDEDYMSMATFGSYNIPTQVNGSYAGNNYQDNYSYDSRIQAKAVGSRQSY